jgi:hypothetical protein
MRVSRTPLAFAAVLLVAACGTSSPQIVAPESTSKDGVGQFGSGNAIAADTTSSPTAERGVGQFGSGN